ncbi:hypothetical protein RB213_015348, partial [Colletotrichum asianum]
HTHENHTHTPRLELVFQHHGRPEKPNVEAPKALTSFVFPKSDCFAFSLPITHLGLPLDPI